MRRFADILFRGAPALCGLLLLTSCALTPRIETLDDLINALQEKGIRFDTREPLDFSGMRFAQIDEGVRLTGQDLHVELLRVEDERTFKLASGAGVLMDLLGDAAKDSALQPPEVVARAPFVVVIRQEPERGAVRRALDELLPGESPN